MKYSILLRRLYTMKYGKIVIILLVLLLLSGCSSSSDKSPERTITATPGTSIGATPTEVLLTTAAYTVAPTASPTASPVPTKAPSPTPIPLPSNDRKAMDILDSMTLEEKIGQMFFVRCNAATATEDIKKYYFGGYILFANDFEGKSKADMISTIQGYQKASDLTMLIGVDEEGGTVNRVSKYTAFRATPFMSPQELYRLGGFDKITRDTEEKAKLLKSLGINVNLAPVCDVSTNSSDFIYQRAFGKDAKQTSNYVTTVVEAMKSSNIGCTLKHFPGYGNNVDTHTGIAIDKRSSASFYQNDFLPFTAGIKAGAGSVLVSHNIVNCFDKKHPASLSPTIHKLLRKDLNFTGVIMTDDLTMDAIRQYTGKEEAAVLAVQAGNDLLIATDYGVQIPAVIKAVKDKKITAERIDESVLRILMWKLELGIIK